MHNRLQKGFNEQRFTARIPSERSSSLEVQTFLQQILQQLLIVHLVGVSVPNVQRAFCGV
jgi:hypothetical protein